ncbi:hypothetical protein FQN60_000568 [Etheostoma spectabile]|uniref:Uncharacterized protein n=1 Tax=Etheostoma spectabile TaxID=54343 RepID=A0A5J5CWL6_9PERO|nr:hypothetical protein FQN60_000568 [Etheostoma spectabile]
MLMLFPCCVGISALRCDERLRSNINISQNNSVTARELQYSEERDYTDKNSRGKHKRINVEFGLATLNIILKCTGVKPQSAKSHYDKSSPLCVLYWTRQAISKMPQTNKHIPQFPPPQSPVSSAVHHIGVKEDIVPAVEALFGAVPQVCQSREELRAQLSAGLWRGKQEDDSGETGSQWQGLTFCLYDPELELPETIIQTIANGQTCVTQLTSETYIITLHKVTLSGICEVCEHVGVCKQGQRERQQSWRGRARSAELPEYKKKRGTVEPRKDVTRTWEAWLCGDSRPPVHLFYIDTLKSLSLKPGLDEGFLESSSDAITNKTQVLLQGTDIWHIKSFKLTFKHSNQHLPPAINMHEPPSAERLYDRNQSEGNCPYTSTDVPTHRYRHERKGKREIDTWGEQERKGLDNETETLLILVWEVSWLNWTSLVTNLH